MEAIIPEEFLIKCGWGAPLKSPTQEAVDEAMLNQYEKAVECYLRHNGFVDYYRDKVKRQEDGK